MGVWHIHGQLEMESCCLLCHMCSTGMVWDGPCSVGVRPFSRGSPVLVDQNVVDGGWCGELGRPQWVTDWFVDVITYIISNEKVLNRMQNSPRGSPASQVFPHVLKSPRCIHQCVISILGTWTHQCMCTAWPSCSCIVGGAEVATNQFGWHPMTQMMSCWAGDIKHALAMLHARGKRRASGWKWREEPNKWVISHKGENPAQSLIHTIYSSLCKFNQITVLILVSYLLVISNGIFRYIWWSPKWALKAAPDMPYTILIFLSDFLTIFGYVFIFASPLWTWNQCTTSCPPPFPQNFLLFCCHFSV